VSIDFAFMLIFEAVGQPLYAVGGALLAAFVLVAIGAIIHREGKTLD